MEQTGSFYDDQPPLIKAALNIAASGLPVFPTADKVPVWSNSELGVEPGNGGYKIATTDPKRVVELFSHPRAREIAVPMGEMSGLMCIDVDLHKGAAVREWLDKNREWLELTRAHTTRSGGLHFLFSHDGKRWPAQLAEGVDVKAGGAGYICWPGTPGYEVISELPVQLPPDGLSGPRKNGISGNEAEDADLIAAIQSSSDIYPPLRTLSMRLASRRISREKMINTLCSIMWTSAAADPGHRRHADWRDRFSKIEELVESAIAKEARLFSETESAAIMQGASLIRPIGPQRETTAADIEARVADSDIELITVDSLRQETLPAIEWLVDQMIPAGGTVSLGGTSNVGKTRWLAHLVVCLSSGTTELMGLPGCQKSASLWIANEEHVEDIKRRIKAAAQHMSVADGEVIAVRGKTEGTLRLVAINEVGTAEIDEDNVAKIVGWIRKVGARLVILDPYVTLSDAMDENSAGSAAMLTKAFLLISAMTGAAVMHAHHTPKDRSKDADWYRGDSGAWRGSGAIYSALDCGFTLSQFIPGASRKAWKQATLTDNLGRWIVLDTGKIREGKPLSPIVYELVGEQLPEGFEIGVCRLSTAHEAENCLLMSDVRVLAQAKLVDLLLDELGPGDHKLADAHRVLCGREGWPLNAPSAIDNAKYDALRDLVGGGFEIGEYSVELKKVSNVNVIAIHRDT